MLFLPSKRLSLWGAFGNQSHSWSSRLKLRRVASPPAWLHAGPTPLLAGLEEKNGCATGECWDGVKVVWYGSRRRACDS